MVLDGGFIPAEKRVILFGRYRGKPLGSLPSGYLRWLASEKSLQQGHFTIWAHLAKQVLRARSAFDGLAEKDFEKQEKPTSPELPPSHSAPWTSLLNDLDASLTCVNPSTYISLLKWCVASKSLIHGRRVHHHIFTSGLEQHPHLGSLIIQMYGEYGALNDAHAFLVATRPGEALPWNLMMKAYAQHGHGKEVLKLFEIMLTQEVEPNRVTILSILTECGKLALLDEGRLTHNYTMSIDLLTDVVVGNAFITMYGKCGSLDDAFRVFEQSSKFDIVTWNASIAALGQNGLSQMALNLYAQMKLEGTIPDDITYVSILDACASSSALLEGCHIHVHVLAVHLESNLVVGTALVNMYGKCGKPDDARRSFDKILQRNTICWTAMIAAYAQNNRGKDALQLFSLMEQGGVRPTKVTFVSVLDACASSANLCMGEELFVRIKNTAFATDLKVGTALINMYGRCGRVEDARSIFDGMRVRDLATWNAMIAAYTQHGQAKHAFQLFDQMKRQGERPDIVTYVSILSMCSRAGLIHEAYQLFTSMEHDYGIDPIDHHHNCMIDLLAKAGQLDEAECLVQDMPSQPSVMALLGACKNQVDIKRGKRMAQMLFRLGRGGEDPNVMMSGIRAAHSVHKVAIIASKSNERLVRKTWLGSCSIKVGGRLHEFVSGERSHPLMDDIMCELTRLTMEMQRAGYFSSIPQKDLEAFDQQEHTGMLAAAFGLISTSPGTQLYMMKSTNLCTICHTVVEYISKATSRKIYVKDVTHLHCFKDGLCSCAGQ